MTRREIVVHHSVIPGESHGEILYVPTSDDRLDEPPIPGDDDGIAPIEYTGPGQEYLPSCKLEFIGPGVSGGQIVLNIVFGSMQSAPCEPLITEWFRPTAVYVHCDGFDIEHIVPTNIETRSEYLDWLEGVQ